MRKIYITGGEILTGAGDLDSTWSTLMAGQTALTPKRVDMAEAFPLGVISGLTEAVGTAGRVEELLLSLFQNLPPLPKNTPLICATTKGAIDELFTRPTTNSGQIWQIGEHIRSLLRLNGEISTISAACASGTIALIQGGMRIAQDECDQVLVVALDILSNFVVGGFGSLKGLSPTPCRPFDKNRDGLSLGEGAGWLLLSSNKEQHGDRSPCRLADWSVSCDATHITAPCRRGSGLIRVLDEIISKSTQPIGAVNAHGTGTIYNDAMELLAFGNSLGNSTPIHSVKGCIGHCLAGAGLIETAISMKSLEENLIPPTIGLLEPEDTDMTLSGHDPIHLQYPTVLSCNSGFGGINAAVLVSRP